MGASGWMYMVPYQDDLKAALDSLRRRVFAEGEFVSPADEGLAEPESVDDLLEQDYYAEFMGTCGTHSIIDVLDVVLAEAEDQDYGTIRPLTEDETWLLFGTSRPSRADFDAVNDDVLYDRVTAGRWTGRAVVLWAEGKPSEIAFWGYSGD